MVAIFMNDFMIDQQKRRLENLYFRLYQTNCAYVVHVFMHQQNTCALQPNRFHHKTLSGYLNKLP